MTFASMNRWNRLGCGLIAVFFACAGSSSAQDDNADLVKKLSRDLKGPIPIWTYRPFDRLVLKNKEQTAIDVEPDRLAPDKDFGAVEANNWCGVMGLPQGNTFRKDIWYRFTNSADGLKYEVVGKGIGKIILYEEIIILALEEELARAVGGRGPVKFDDCNEFIRILFERLPLDRDLQNRLAPRYWSARIRFHAAEAYASGFAQQWDQAFWSLDRERKVRAMVPAEVKLTTDARTLIPLDERFTEVFDRWMQYMFSLRRYEEGRRVVARFEAIHPNHATAAKWRDEYDRLTSASVSAAAPLEQNGFYVEALAALDAAAQIQPDHPQLIAAFNRIYAVHPRLRVAVGETPSFRGGPAIWSPGDRRGAELLHEPLMRLRGVRDGVSEFESRIVEGLSSTDLNRQATISVRSGLVWPGDGKPVTPVDLQRILSDSTQASGTLFHPALAFLVTNLQAKPPAQVDISFERPQFQARAWLQIPFLRMGIDPSASSATSAIGWSGMGPFRASERRSDRVLYRANPKYFEPGRPKIKQIVEIEYPTPEDRMRALEHGDVDMVEFVPFRNLSYVGSLKNVVLMRQTTPKVHFIQFNMRKLELRNPALRRAMVYALDREAVCKRVGVKLDEEDRLVTGPMPFKMFGYNHATEQWSYNPQLAKMLVSAVRKEMKSMPPLILAHQGNESTRLACDEIARQLGLVGIPVNVVDVDERSPDPRDADLRYQAVRVTDPVYDLVTILTRDNPSLFKFAGPRLRQMLIDLLQVPNATLANRLVPEIHQALHDEVSVLPLWQWRDPFLVAKNVSGMPAAPATFYAGVTEWSVAPTYPPALWTSKNTQVARRGDVK